MKLEKWFMASVLWLGWNLLISAVAMNLGVTWAFHSDSVSTQARLGAVGSAWFSNRIYAALIATGIIVLFSFSEWRKNVSWRQWSYQGFFSFLHHHVLLIAIVLGLIFSGTYKWIGISSMTEQGAITPILWFLAFLEIFALFAAIFIISREYLGQFIGPKTKPEIKSLFTAALETAILSIWLQPTWAESTGFFFLSFACKNSGSAIFGLGLSLSSALAIAGLNLFALELPSLIRLAPTDSMGLDLFNHWGFAVGTLVWALRMWYPEIYERIQSRFKRNASYRPSGPGR